MLTIYKKELKLYFSSRSTYLILAAFCMCFGILCAALNLYLGKSSISYPLGYLVSLLPLFLPLLLLFSMLREQGGDCEKLCSSLPIRTSSIVLGTYAAALTTMLLPLLLFACLPFVFSAYGKSPIGTSETAVLGFFLYMAFCIALIQFLFSSIRKKALSIPLAFGIPVLLQVWNLLYSLLPQSGIVERFLKLTNPVRMCYAFTYGKFYLPGLLYFLSLIGILLFLRWCVLQKQQGAWERSARQTQVRAVSCALAAGLLVINFGFSFLPERLSNIDVTGSNIFRISGQTLDLLHSVNEPVRICFLCSGGKNAADGDIYSFLKRYEEECSFLTLEVIDTEKEPNFADTYSTQTLNDQSLIIIGSQRYFVLDSNDLYHYENQDLDMRLSPTDYAYLIRTYINYEQTGATGGLDTDTLSTLAKLYYSSSTSAFFDGDTQIANAIRYVTLDQLPTVCMFTGNTGSMPDSAFRDLLLENGFFLKTIDTLNDLSQDCALLILFSPSADLTEADSNTLRQYLDEGGNLFLATDYSKSEFPLLASLLADYGMEAEHAGQVVCEGKQSNTSGYDYIFRVTVSTFSDATEKNATFTAILPHAIAVSDRDGVTVTPWLTSSEKGYLRLPDETDREPDDYERYCCGALAEAGETSILWLASPLSASSTGNTLSSGNNFQLLLAAFQQMTDFQYQPLSISSVQMTSTSLTLTVGELAVWALVLIVLIPITIVMCGCIRVYLRKRK